MTRLLLVLDLDETLVHASEEPKGTPDFQAFDYYVLRRPQVVEFLSYVANLFDVAIWTASSADYAEKVVANILPRDYPLRFLWAHDRCTQRWTGSYPPLVNIKDLKKVRRRLGIPLERIIAVDDSPEKYQRQYSNCVVVEPFEGDLMDRELALLAGYLKTLASVDNVRPIEKRGWRKRTEPHEFG